MAAISEQQREDLARKFSRPTTSLGIRTLGDAILGSYTAMCNNLGKPSGHPDWLHLHNVMDPPIKAAIDRIGSPVCIHIETGDATGWTEDNLIDGQYMLANIASDGNPGYCQADWGFADQEEWADSVNGYEYAPDGSRLAMNRG